MLPVKVRLPGLGSGGGGGAPAAGAWAAADAAVSINTHAVLATSARTALPETLANLLVMMRDLDV